MVIFSPTQLNSMFEVMQPFDPAFQPFDPARENVSYNRSQDLPIHPPHAGSLL